MHRTPWRNDDGPAGNVDGSPWPLVACAGTLVLVTEFVAFFHVQGWSRLSDAEKAKTRGDFFGFSRSAFGRVQTRTDGQRLLVYTNSGNVEMKKAYAYQLDVSGVPTPAAVKRA